MRTVAIGDVHGCRRALELLLEEVRPVSDDVVVMLGDYVDRGPDSWGVVERLLRLRGECVLRPLKGNHEVMMLESRGNPVMERQWRGHGGDATLRSYAPRAWRPKLADVSAEHWEFLETGLLDYWETETHIFVHANAAPDLAMRHQSPQALFWQFLSVDARPHYSGKTLITGHTSQKSGMPAHFGHTTCLDTCAWCGGWLTALLVEARVLIQVSEEGMVRELELDALPVMPGGGE